jgi:hypothetical protein
MSKFCGKIGINNRISAAISPGISYRSILLPGNTGYSSGALLNQLKVLQLAIENAYNSNSHLFKSENDFV